MMIRALSVVAFLVSGASSFAPSSHHRRHRHHSFSIAVNLFAPDYYDTYDDENYLHIPNRLAFTTRQWKDEDDAQEAFKMLVESGITFCSCEGGGEELLGGCMDSELKAIVATTYNQRFQFGGAPSVTSRMEASLEQLNVEEVQLLQCRPSRASVGGLKALAEGMVNAIDEGYCVSGGSIDITSPAKLKALCREMSERDESLITNQFEFSLVNRKHERMIEACKDNDVIPLVKFPLGRDLLASGKWTSEDPNGTEGSMRFSLKVLEKWEPLHSMQYRLVEKVQKRVGKGPNRELKDYRDRRYEGKKTSHVVTPAQIAINYIVAKGAVPLVDAHDAETAQDVLGCLGWRLTDEEVALLDQAAELSSM